MSPDEVTACLVTRGNINLRPILDGLIFKNVIVWDNSRSPNCRTFGRYAAMIGSATDVVYVQDDDLVLPAESQRALLAMYEPGCIVANVPDWKQMLTFLGYGSVMGRALAGAALAPYLNDYLHEEGFQMVGCDVLVSLRNTVVEASVPFELRPEALGPGRASGHPRHEEWKRQYMDLACA